MMHVHHMMRVHHMMHVHHMMCVHHMMRVHHMMNDIDYIRYVKSRIDITDIAILAQCAIAQSALPTVAKTESKIVFCMIAKNFNKS